MRQVQVRTLRALAVVLLFSLAAHTPVLTAQVADQVSAGKPNEAPAGDPPPTDEPATADGRLALIRHHGARLPLDATFLDDRGVSRKLRHYFDGERPVVLTLNYFRCPQLCGLQLNALVDGGDGPRAEGVPGGLRSLDELPGREYTLLTVSFDAVEGPRLAGLKKETYVEFLGREGADEGWHFLTGKKEAIEALTKAVGFRFKWTGTEYAHPSIVVFLTPDGRVSDYLTGFNYDRAAIEVRMARAALGQVGPTGAGHSPFDGLPAISRGGLPTWPFWLLLTAIGVVTFLAIFFGRRAFR